MKKYILAVSIAMALVLSACGSTGTESVSESVSETESIAASQEEVSSSETEESEESSEAAESEAAALPELAEYVPVEGLSTTYADLDNRAFAYDGKVYKLGEVTLQELIDAGLPFDSGDLKNADNNINGNHETTAYNLKINDQNSMQFRFINSTDNDLTEKECILSSVRWYPLYVPHDDYQESLNTDIINYLNDCSTHLTFAFPLYVKKSELLENSPEPTKSDEYNNVSYTTKSEVYMGSSGYSFQFDKDTEQIKDVTISWMP